MAIFRTTSESIGEARYWSLVKGTRGVLLAEESMICRLCSRLSRTVCFGEDYNGIGPCLDNGYFLIQILN